MKGKDQMKAAPVPGSAEEFMTCQEITRRGTRCTRRIRCGKYDNGREAYCATHARLAGWPVWMWG